MRVGWTSPFRIRPPALRAASPLKPCRDSQNALKFWSESSLSRGAGRLDSPSGVLDGAAPEQVFVEAVAAR